MFAFENIGWAGSSHDNRVWRNWKAVIHFDTYFEDDEYLIGDSAYQPSSILIPSFKCSGGGQLSLKEMLFNLRLANIRIRVEHCIGVLKERSSLLRRLHSRLKNDKFLAQATPLIHAAIILRNMAIHDCIPEEWVDKDDADDNDVVNVELLSGAASGNRREYLRDYLFDK